MTDTKPYGCSVCGRKFGRGEHLRRHASAHGTVKPFQCNFCQKRFARKYFLFFFLTQGTFCTDTMPAAKLPESSLHSPKSRLVELAIDAKSLNQDVPEAFRASVVRAQLKYVPFLDPLRASHKIEIVHQPLRPPSPSRNPRLQSLTLLSNLSTGISSTRPFRI